MTKPILPHRRIIFPLDVPDWPSAERLARALSGKVGYFKIGLELFIAAGPDAVKRIRGLGGDTGIFLDLKLHDIPATVGRAAKAASRLGADLLTVHASGGREMIGAAREAAGDTKILAVTVLTSLDPGKEDLGVRSELTEPGALVRFRAETALASGADGLVCSGREAAELRSLAGDGPLLVTPGIRPAWSVVAADDQKRIVTPAMALASGADLIVVGRPIRDAPDPALAAMQIAGELELESEWNLSL